MFENQKERLAAHARNTKAELDSIQARANRRRAGSHSLSDAVVRADPGVSTPPSAMGWSQSPSSTPAEVREEALV